MVIEKNHRCTFTWAQAGTGRKSESVPQKISFVKKKRIEGRDPDGIDEMCMPYFILG